MRGGFTIFETAGGVMGLAWSDGEITRLALPEESEAALRARFSHDSDATPPEWILELVSRLQRHVAGDVQDFGDVPLSWRGMTPFRRRVSELLREVSPGHTVTYGALAERAGSTHAARAVGGVMATNPFPILVPCHRVVGANGLPGGFTASGGLSMKARLLEAEGVALSLPRDGELFPSHGGSIRQV